MLIFGRLAILVKYKQIRKNEKEYRMTYGYCRRENAKINLSDSAGVKTCQWEQSSGDSK